MKRFAIRDPLLARCLIVSWLGVVAGSLVSLGAAEHYREPFRPQYHFTPATNWMNDPNGMVFYEGEFHLFYQYNPFGDKWGHMSWGHAVSRDLVRWEHLPVALEEADGVMVFSGSAVVDWGNTSGFGVGGRPPLVAIYTGHHTNKPLQNQQLAYSTDRGRTWTKYAGNPVLDIGAKDFRDPKVMWHESTGRWIMTVALPTDRKVRFYASPDLRQWTALSDFGPAGAVKGIWECPDLFPVRVEGSRKSKWVLIVNIGGDSVAGGSGCQYFVGDFDGTRFAPEAPAQAGAGDIGWVDYGKDFYAAVSWSDVPKRDGRRLWLGWMSNWQYANDVPTSPWRSAMTIVRALTLRNSGGRWALVQTPVKELERLRGRRFGQRAAALAGSMVISAPAGHLSGEYEIETEFRPSADAVFTLELRKGGSEATTVRVDIPGGMLTLDRTRSGKVDFHKDFPAVVRAPIRLERGRLRLRAFVDTSSVELFVNGGETVLTSLPSCPGRSRASRCRTGCAARRARDRPSRRRTGRR